MPSMESENFFSDLGKHKRLERQLYVSPFSERFAIAEKDHRPLPAILRQLMRLLI